MLCHDVMWARVRAPMLDAPPLSSSSQKRLIKKCRELNAEIVANAAKIQTALRLSLQDQNSITLLKKEIDKAWKVSNERTSGAGAGCGGWVRTDV